MKNFRNTISNKLNEAYMCPIIIGIFLILVGLFIQVPGGALTTYKFLDGDKAEDYVFDDKYSSIDEYVGGDAYNYIIGASLVAGEISGVITAKAIFVVGGTLCLCLGITLKMLQKKTESFQKLIQKLVCLFYFLLLLFLLFAMSATMMITTTSMVTTRMTFSMVMFMMITFYIRIIS